MGNFHFISSVSWRGKVPLESFLVYLSWLSSVNSLTAFVLRRVAEGGHSSTLLRDGIGRRRRRTGRERAKSYAAAFLSFQLFQLHAGFYTRDLSFSCLLVTASASRTDWNSFVVYGVSIIKAPCDGRVGSCVLTPLCLEVASHLLH